MNEISLEALGITKEALEEKIVDAAVERLLDSRDIEGSDMWKLVSNRVQAGIDEAVEKLYEAHVLPNIEEYVANVTFTKSNRWGEEEETPKTFREYLAERAENYITEKVNHKGETQDEDRYNWKAKSTRIAHMIHEHIDAHIKASVASALKSLNEQVGEGLATVVKVKIAEILARLEKTGKV